MLAKPAPRLHGKRSGRVPSATANPGRPTGRPTTARGTGLISVKENICFSIRYGFLLTMNKDFQAGRSRPIQNAERHCPAGSGAVPVGPPSFGRSSPTTVQGARES